MNLTLLKNCYENGCFRIVERCDSWEEAVRMAAQPMIEEGYIEAEYAEKTIDMVHEYGPYICITKHVCIPHAFAPELVKKTGIGFMKLNEPVSFSDNPNEIAELFFVLASTDSQSHLQLLQDFAAMAEDEETINALVDAKSEENFKALLNI